MSVALRTITRLQDADDINVTPGAGVDEYALCWDNDTAKFVLRQVTAGVTDHGALTGLADDDHTQYLLATGARTGANSQAQTFTNGIIGPTWKPASDSTTALKIQNAAGASDIVTVDTTNKHFGINAAATGEIAFIAQDPRSVGEHIAFQGTGSGRPVFYIRENNTANRAVFRTDLVNGWNFVSLKEGTGTQHPLMFGFAVSEPTLYLDPAGYVSMGLNDARGAPVLQVVKPGELYRRVGVNILHPDSTLHVVLDDAATNAASQLLTLSHNTSGTVANGFGSRVLWELESSTTADQSAAAIKVLWNDATHASRKADLVLTAYDSGGEREGLRIRGDGSAPAIGLLGAAPIARIAHVADPSGGATVDAEARSAINSILATLEGFGFHATS